MKVLSVALSVISTCRQNHLIALRLEYSNITMMCMCLFLIQGVGGMSLPPFNYGRSLKWVA